MTVSVSNETAKGTPVQIFPSKSKQLKEEYEGNFWSGNGEGHQG